MSRKNERNFNILNCLVSLGNKCFILSLCIKLCVPWRLLHHEQNPNVDNHKAIAVVSDCLHYEIKVEIVLSTVHIRMCATWTAPMHCGKPYLFSKLLTTLTSPSSVGNLTQFVSSALTVAHIIHNDTHSSFGYTNHVPSTAVATIGR